MKRPRWHYLAAAAAAIAALASAAFFIVDRSPAARPMLVAGFDGLRTYGDPQSLTIRQYAILRTLGSPVDAEIVLPASGEILELRVLPEFPTTHALSRAAVPRERRRFPAECRGVGRAHAGSRQLRVPLRRPYAPASRPVSTDDHGRPGHGRPRQGERLHSPHAAGSQRSFRKVPLTVAPFTDM